MKKQAQEKTKKNKNVKIIVIVSLGIAMFAAIVATIALLCVNAGDRHDDAVAKYHSAWSDYSGAQYNFGYSFGAMLSELDFSVDGSTKYNLDETSKDELMRDCARETGAYYEIFDSPYAVEDTAVEKKDTGDIELVTNKLVEHTDKINKAKESLEQCKEMAEAKKKEIDEEVAKKEAEEKKQAEERKKAEDEYNKNVLDYEKFTKKIKEGMSLKAVKNVYRWFDEECKISSQSGGWVYYSCSPTSYSSDYWAAVFAFYNGVLKSKSQSGLK